MWKGPKEFFNYNRKQRNGLLVLIFVAILIQLFIYFDHLLLSEPNEDDGRIESVIAEWERNEEERKESEKEDVVSYVMFDPNQVSQELLVDLGLQGHLASRVVKYRNSGGVFRSKSDLLNIYGMDTAWYHQVAPYISIENAVAEKSHANRGKQLKLEPFEVNSVSLAELKLYNIKEWQARRIINYREKVNPYKSKEELYKVYGLDSSFVDKLLPFVEIEEEDSPGPMLIELNGADSLQLIEVRGIGPVYAHRILQYRERLGGFYLKEQLLEVFGIGEKEYSEIEGFLEVDQSLVKKMDLNEASFKELLRHPYLSYEQVKNIVNFREQVRPYASIDELKNIELIDDTIFSKIANYLNPPSGSLPKE